MGLGTGGGASHSFVATELSCFTHTACYMTIYTTKANKTFAMFWDHFLEKYVIEF